MDGRNALSQSFCRLLCVLFLCARNRRNREPNESPYLTVPGNLRRGAQGAATLVRSELSQAESETTMEFSVALKMRDFAALKERIARNEVISADEMAAKYLPTAADYANVAKWLATQGFSVKPATLDRLSIFASGTVAQLQQVLGTKFGRVNMAGAEYTSALTPPSLPGEIAPSVLGINGLQPHLHPHRHYPVKQPCPALKT